MISAALVPQEPIARRQGFNTVAGVLLGGMLSVATATFLEARDKSLKTVEAVRQAFGLTVLGMIPQLKSERINLRDGNLELPTPELVVKNSPHSSFSQAYRMLQANLKFLSYDQKLKVFVVTSSVPKEGKSTVSANLAVAMAQLGRKVLLVDADMHHPLQHRIWELPNSLGLSNLLVGQTEVKTAIRKVMTNLHILTAGVAPPNPMALVDSQRMASLMEIFAANYDFTIIDTPPLSVAAEAPILGKMAGSVLLVVRPEVVDTASAARAKEFLEQSHQNVIGMVVNGVISENEPYSYYDSSKLERAESSTFPIEDVSLGLTARNR